MAKSKKRTNSSSIVSVTLPATVGRVSKAQGLKRQMKKGAPGSSFVAAPSSLGVVSRTGTPNFRSTASADGRVRVQHREFITDIQSVASAYNVQSLAINPALPDCFPWLAALASCYEAYRFRSLQFEYMPSVGTNTAGIVMLAVDYDAGDPNPTTKKTFMQTHGAIRVSPWNVCAMSCDGPDLHKFPQRYTRKTPWTGNGDIKTYDVGKILYATDGFAGAGTVCGELYVSYDVELITPQPVIYAPEAFSADVVGVAPLTTSKPFGNVVLENSPVLKTSQAVPGQFDFLRTGQYLLQLSANATSAASGNYSLNNSSNVTATNVSTAKMTDYLTQVFELTVSALPASLLPILVGVTSPSSGNMRLAPFLNTASSTLLIGRSAPAPAVSPTDEKTERPGASLPVAPALTPVVQSSPRRY